MSFSGKLFPYQRADVDKMIDVRKVLVGYGQGTGKTVMTIATVEHCFDHELITEPGLIVCLSSLKYQWSQAIRQFTGGELEENPKTGLPHWTGGTSEPLVIDGTPKQRAAQYKAAASWAGDYVILSFEQVVQDWEQVRRLPRGFVVVDEASFIKGFRAQRSSRVKRLQAPYRYALTGTPIENGKPEELFSIMQFVDDEVLGRWDIFDRAFIERNQFGGVKRYRNIPVFTKRMQPHMVRRTIADPAVAKFMPQVSTKDPLLVQIDTAAGKLYRHITEELLEDLHAAAQLMGSGISLEALYGVGGPSSEENSLKGRIGQKTLALQMLCDHPELLRVSAAKWQAVFDGTATSGGSSYAAQLREDGWLDTLKRTPKLDALAAWAQPLLDADERNKLVIFSNYVAALDLIGARLSKTRHVTFHGGLSAKEKDYRLTKFQHDPSVRLFVSSDAGGYGIDVPQANHLLNYSLPDRWGTADQRDTRIVRASSTFPAVSIWTLLVAGSIEVRKHAALAHKGAVSRAFVDGRGINRAGGIDSTLASLTAYLEEHTV